jgi:serine/threonine protein kinase
MPMPVFELIIQPLTLLNERYLVLDHVGSGGFGELYRAKDQRLDKTVAVKQIHIGEELQRENIRIHISRLIRLNHPALVKIFDYFSEPHGFFLVMEFIPGERMSEMLYRSSGSLPVMQVYFWGLELLSAVKYLHHHNITHSDIKPQNVLLTSDQRIVLADFGVARALETTQPSDRNWQAYFAPEQLKGHVVLQSDLYSIGATLYYLLTGVQPLDPLSRLDAVNTKGADALVPPNVLNRNITQSIAEVLQRAMSLDIANRPNVDEMTRLWISATSQFVEAVSEIPADEKPHRTLVRITGLTDASGEKMVEAVVPSWCVKEVVHFPVSLIPEHIHDKLKVGLRLFANVNIGAENTDKLTFDDFEIAPEPDPQDGLS